MELFLQHSTLLTICIVEDDDLYRLALARTLKQYGRVIELADLESAKSYLTQNTPDIAFIDLNLGIDDNKGSGLELINIVVNKPTYSVVISGHTEDEIIDECLSRGADDYYVKGDEAKIVDDIFTRLRAQREDETLLKTQHPLFKQNLEILKINAKTDFPILLHGSTGTGKTFLAQKTYNYIKPEGSFVTVNCSSISPQLFESEMFGHTKGAFTGADKSRSGWIKEADKGVLFLDEIDSMPLDQQAKLLKVIEEKEFYPVGSSRKVSSSFKLICAAQSDLLEKVKKSEFREDLYFRISGITIPIPSLKDRKIDIYPLFKDFLKRNPRRLRFDQGAKDLIESYDWPGNIRELQMLSRQVTSLKQSKVSSYDIRSFFRAKASSSSPDKLLTQKHIEFIEEKGLNEFIEQIRNQLFFEYREQGLNNSVIAQRIGVNRSTLHRWEKY